MSIADFNTLVLGWHGVDGDTRTWRAEMVAGPNSTQPPAKWARAVVDSPSCFAAPAFAAIEGGGDRNGHAGLAAMMGPGSPSAIQLEPLGSGGLDAPAVPPSFQTTTRPAVEVDGSGHVSLAWRDPDGTLKISSQQGGSHWTPFRIIGRTSHSPGMAAGVVAWKPDDGIQIQGFTTARGTKAMVPQGGGMLTSDAPALCRSGDGRLVMAWKGVPGDERIFWSRSQNGLDWETPREAIPQDGGIRTIAGPAIAVWRFGFVLVWRGVTGDQKLWWSTLGLNDVFGRWRTPTPIDVADNSNSSPTLLSCITQFID